jgi:antitoxin HicB
MPKRISQKILKYTAIFEPAEEGGYVVSVPSLPGCITEGDTLGEAIEMVKDAILAYIASLKEHHQPVPEEKDPSFVKIIDVSIPLTP